MNLRKFSAFLAFILTLAACATKKVSSFVYVNPPAPDPSNPALVSPVEVSFHGVVAKTNDEELGLVILNGVPGLVRPGLIISCKEQLPPGTPVEIEMSNLFVPDQGAAGVEQNCLRITIRRLHVESAEFKPPTIVVFRANMFASTVFRGMGTIANSNQKVAFVALQHASAERKDLPVIYIDALPALEPNDPVTCFIKQIELEGDKLPEGRPHIAFRVTIKKFAGKMVGPALVKNGK